MVAKVGTAVAENKNKINITHDEAYDWLEKMILIRQSEEHAEEAYGEGKIGGFLHLYIGEEAIAVGARAGLLPDDDVDPKLAMAEIEADRATVDRGERVRRLEKLPCRRSRPFPPAR